MLEESVAEKLKTHIFLSIILFLNRVVCKVMWRNKVKLDMQSMTAKRVPQTPYLHVGEIRQEFKHPRIYLALI
jgi:hypothetical protein